MCKNCGCDDPHHTHAHTGGHGHHHGDGRPAHSHTHDAVGGDAHEHDESGRVIRLEQRILSHNDEVARRNRAWLKARGIVAINMISSPGSGKTYLLEKTLTALRGKLPCAVITGDQKTDNDARRLRGKGAPVTQIETNNACHLDADRVAEALPGAVADDTRILFIENVGNLVCPAAFDLGEDFKIALLSVTEGEDKPAKYPSLFAQAPVVLLTKTDLIPHLDWSLSRCRENLRTVRPGVFVLELSARTGDGMAAWLAYLQSLV